MVSSQQVILRCASGTHRVRLKPDRFWAAARCPVCRTRIDPTRFRRILTRLVPGWEFPRTSGPGELGLAASSFGYLAGALVVWVLLWGFGDSWWPGTLVLFGPRWVFLLPSLVLAPLAAWQKKWLLAPVTLAALIFLLPVMGLRFGAGGAADSEADRDIRVMTYNIASGEELTRAMWEILGSTGVDVAAFQECGLQVFERLREETPDWSHHRSGSACIATRFAIDTAVTMDRETLEMVGGAGWVVRYTLRTPWGPLDLTNVHLDTPRAGLEPISSGEFSAGLPKLREKTIVRDVESRRAREMVDTGNRPFIVTGDFNMPVESNIYESHWSDLANAFNEVGRGFGATRYNGWIRARIDHILHSDDLVAIHAFVGPDFGSDHRPMIADLNWR